MTHDYWAQMAGLPGSKLDVSRMPGHWLLARLGKRVLRPGGSELTRALLDGLAIGPQGGGVCARSRRDGSCNAVHAATRVSNGTQRRCNGQPRLRKVA